MSETPPILANRALAVLRIGVAVLLAVHGYTRLIQGTVPLFGGYLSSVGFPLGLAMAWGITGFEIIGTACLVTGRLVRLVVPGHMGILLAGIILVHGREGWFVVGGGRNGVEYSVLLLIALGSIFLATPAKPATLV